MTRTHKRYCTNHIESIAQFYCPNCMKFLCSECVDETIREEGVFEACRMCGQTCVPSNGVTPPNITEIPKEKAFSVFSSFLGLIFHPVDTVDLILDNLSLSLLLTRILPIYLVSQLWISGLKPTDFSAADFMPLLFQIQLLVSFVVVIEIIGRVANIGGDKIKGPQYFLAMLTGAMYVYTILNVCVIFTGFVPSYLVRVILSQAVGFWGYCLWSLFISQIYDLDFWPAFLIAFVALSVAMIIGLSLFFFLPLGV